MIPDRSEWRRLTCLAISPSLSIGLDALRLSAEGLHPALARTRARRDAARDAIPSPALLAALRLTAAVAARTGVATLCPRAMGDDLAQALVAASIDRGADFVLTRWDWDRLIALARANGTPLPARFSPSARHGLRGDHARGLGDALHGALADLPARDPLRDAPFVAVPSTPVRLLLHAPPDFPHDALTAGAWFGGPCRGVVRAAAAFFCDCESTLVVFRPAALPL